MISGKIILKSATKLSLDQRFGEIAKRAPPPAPRVQQQTNVIIPQSRQNLFGNKRSTAVNIANRLKKRSINYRLGMGNDPVGNRRQYGNPRPQRVFQRLSLGNRRRGGGANSYLFGGQSGMGIRLRGQGRIGTRIFRSKTRGYLNNNAISRYGGPSRRGNNNNNNNRGRRFGNRPNRGRGRGGNKNFTRGRGNNRRNANNNNPQSSVTKESLDDELEKYMAQTKLDSAAIEMN